ncbi:hypothetical protein [Sunxiuqinia indica]|uniref:hypothetical protein n=1 Tax=Sunxiuqinia indica TaxID=2692584 RepID=UPI0013584073|nr:hypothetical protein [Sunxiuqinia indica]
MNYKDKLFEIDEKQIKFRNKTLFPFLIISVSLVMTSWMFSKDNILTAASSIIGVFLAFLLFRLFVGLYLNNTINLSDISFVKAQQWNMSIDKNRNLLGVVRYKYHFPTGLDKKTNPRVIFIHVKEKKTAVGFVPEHFDNAISVLKDRGIEIK